MEASRVRLMEHLAVDCPLSLREFCFAMQQVFGLADFKYDFENETEWGSVIDDSIEYNVSRPYERSTLEDWDASVPGGCNFGVILILLQAQPAAHDADWASAMLVPRVGQRLADLLGRPVYHHRTWLGVGNNVSRKRVFSPKPRSA